MLVLLVCRKRYPLIAERRIDIDGSVILAEHVFQAKVVTRNRK